MLRKIRFALIASALVACSGIVAQAQHVGHGDHSGHGGHAGHAAAPAANESAATKAFRAANDVMHRNMDIAFTGDVDADFARGMIPHHEGAVEMARIVLKYGKDPEIRKLAEEVVRTQETEIKFMREWLAKRGTK